MNETDNSALLAAVEGLNYTQCLTFLSDLSLNTSMQDTNITQTCMENQYQADDSEYLFNWVELVPVLTVYSLTYLVGVTGNSLIIYTILQFRRLKSTTNVFLISLSSADLLLVLVCIPVKVRQLQMLSVCMYTFYFILCKENKFIYLYLYIQIYKNSNIYIIYYVTSQPSHHFPAQRNYEVMSKFSATNIFVLRN